MRGSERSNTGLTRIALISAIIISSVMVGFQRGAVNSNSAPRIATQETIAPLAQVLAVPIRSVENFFGSFNARATAYEDTKTLKEQIAVLRDRQARYDSLAYKVARYEAILGVDTETNIPLEKIAARAIGETDGPFVRSLLLNVGANDGVKIGNPVMSTHGLVGHVINVGAKSTRVLLLSDLNSRIAVASARSNTTAILAGDNSSQPLLSFVNQPDSWRVGDRVISSGDDGALPRGLNIGVVLQDDMGGLRVELASQAEPFDWVWVSPYEKIAPPEEEQPSGEDGP